MSRRLLRSKAFTVHDAGRGGETDQDSLRIDDRGITTAAAGTIYDTRRYREQNADEKSKILLLGPSGSGKTTVLKQFRILYGPSWNNDELRMYGAIVRSNITTAVVKLCELMRVLDLEPKLDEESNASSPVSDLLTDEDHDGGNAMTPREAFDQICAYLVYKTATKPISKLEHHEPDWIGTSMRVGFDVNIKAKLFLQHVDAIRVLWKVSNCIKKIIVDIEMSFLHYIYNI